MKNSISLATRYSDAFFEYLSKEKKLDKFDYFVKGIKKIVERIDGDPAFSELVGNPLLPKDYIVLKLVEASEIDDPIFNNFINALVYKKRQLLLPVIYILLEQKNDELKKVIKVKLITPYKLKENIMKDLEDIIFKKTGRKSIISLELNEELIGGIQLQLENTVFDYSIKGILEKIGREYASKRG